jgi:cell division protein FtsB
MNRKFRYYFSKFLLPGISLTLLLYFIFHLLSGDHGWFSWKSLEKELEEDQKTLELLEEAQRQMENRVKLLRPENLDVDLLEERVRAMLNNGQDAEIVIIDDKIGK